MAAERLALYFARHARNRMRKYAIEPNEVLSAILAPDDLQRGSQGKIIVTKALSRGSLRVVYIVQGERYVVLTSFPRGKWAVP